MNTPAITAAEKAKDKFFMLVEENKKLKEENKKLKEENKKLKLQIKQNDNIISKISPQRTRWNNLIVERNKEIKKLKEEIKLKDEIIRLHESA